MTLWSLPRMIILIDLWLCNIVIYNFPHHWFNELYSATKIYIYLNCKYELHSRTQWTRNAAIISKHIPQSRDGWAAPWSSTGLGYICWLKYTSTRTKAAQCATFINKFGTSTTTILYNHRSCYCTQTPQIVYIFTRRESRAVGGERNAKWMALHNARFGVFDKIPICCKTKNTVLFRVAIIN